MRIMGTADRIFHRRVRALFVALALVFVFISAFIPARAESDGMIRVRLTRLGAPESLTLAVDCEYYLAADPTVRVESGETVTITAVFADPACESIPCRVWLCEGHDLG